MKGLKQDKAEEITQDAAIVLRKSRPTKYNLSREERPSLRDLREGESRIILRVKVTQRL